MGNDSLKRGDQLTRRDFARAAAMAAATAAITPGIAAAEAHRMKAAGYGTSAVDTANAHQAETDARLAEIFRRYGDRLSAEQKTDLRRIAGDLQSVLDKLRAYPLGNEDQPATVLRIIPEVTEARRAPRR